MRKADVVIGATYAAKISGRLTPVQVTGISPYGGYTAQNRRTGRTVHIRSARRLRYRMVRTLAPSGWRRAQD